MATPFKCGFDIEDWKDILPPIPDDYSKIINHEQDDILKQVWVRQEFPQIITTEFIFQEADRIKNGVWILIKGVLLWIPPNFYQFLQYGIAGGDSPQFRLKRLKNVYTKIRVRKNPRFMGTFNIKNRQDGDTTFATSSILWEVISGNLNNGLVGIQSKTRDDAINPCWFTLTSHWNSYPKFFKDSFYPHFVSGNNTAEKFKFSQEADPNNPNDRGKNVEIFYGPSKHNAFDGKNNMKICMLDEIAKWTETSLSLTITNYKKFIMPGKVRKGLFDMFSSPSDTNGRHNDEALELWDSSDPDDLQETGATKSRIFRMYANPLDGIEGFYDEFGDADPQEVFEHIMRERKSMSKDKLMAEVRAFPLPILGTNKPNPEELFGSYNNANIWINLEGIKERRIQILSNKQSLVQYGNLDWPNGVPDSGIPIFRPADTMEFNEETARFCISDTQLPQIELDNLRDPARIPISECLGIDPFNLRYKTKNLVTGSLGAALSWMFRDLLQTGKNNFPTLSYLSRPNHDTIFFEDMIKAAIFRRAKVQYENTNDKLECYFEDRGYAEWMIPEINAKPVEVNGEFKIRKGDAPSGKGATAFMNEGIQLINTALNSPPTPDLPYPLKWFNFEEALLDIIEFNKTDRQQNHFTMALIQALLGSSKLLFKKIRKKSTINNEILNYFQN